MIISAKIFLVIGTAIVISTTFVSAIRPRHNHAVCSPFPHITLDHGKITPIGTQKYLFKCNPGYFLASPPQVRCSRGKWSSTQKPLCLKNEGQCEDPEPPAGGEILGEERHEGAVIQYMCKPGFILMGEGTRTCLRNGYWSGITPTCMDESEPLQSVAERFKEKFVEDVGSHSSDITWDTSRGTKAPCDPGFSCPPFVIVDHSTDTEDDTSRDLTKIEDDYDFSPIRIDFPPTDPNWLRKHKRRHKSKRGKLAFEPSLSTITEDIEREESEAIPSGDLGSGDGAILILDNIPCYKTPRVQNGIETRHFSKKGTRAPSTRHISQTHKARERKRNKKLIQKNKPRSRVNQTSKHRSNMRDTGMNRRRKYSQSRRITAKREEK